MAAVLVSLRLLAQEKPLVPHPFNVETRGAVATLKELWDASDLVVEGIVEGDKPADYGTGWPTIFTMYDVRVLAVFKSTTPGASTPQTIQVRRWGGERDRGSRIDTYIADNYPLFKRGDRFIFFLKQREWSSASPFRGTYFTEATYGPDSVFDVRGTSVRNLGVSRLSESLKASPAEQLRSELRRIGGGR